MLQMRNGIKNIRQQTLRCLLFVLLLFLTSAFGGLGISILQSANEMVRISDAHYVTRVTFRDEDGGNPSEWAASEILSSPDVLASNEVVQGLGKIAGNDNTALELMERQAIISFSIVNFFPKSQKNSLPTLPIRIPVSFFHIYFYGKNLDGSKSRY